MNAKELGIACVAAADELMERRPWERFANEETLSIEVPGHEPLLGTIMGAAGEEYGLFLLAGATAHADLASMMAAASPREVVQLSTILSVSRTRRVEIEPPFDRILQHARRFGRTAPLFLIKEPGQQPRPPRKAELELLLWVLRGLLAADAAGALQPAGSWYDHVLTVLRLDGSLDAPRFAVEPGTFGEAEEAAVPVLELPASLAELPRLASTYFVALPAVPIAIGGDPDEVRALLVVDGASGRILALEVTTGADLAKIVEKLSATLQGESQAGQIGQRGLPQRIFFANALLWRALRSAFDELGVEVGYQASIPELEEVIGRLDEWLAELPEDLEAQLDPYEDLDDDPLDDLDAELRPDDLPGWDAANRRLTERLSEVASLRALDSAQAWRRYFGASRQERPLPPSLRGVLMLASYVEWFATSYRPTKRARAVGARLLVDLPPAERALLATRAAVRPSIYRMAGRVRGDTVRLRDVQSGREHLVTDSWLAKAAVEGVALPARVFAAGAFQFAMPAGPALADCQVEAALAFLEREHDLRLDDGIAPGAAHLLGRLWAWAHEHADPRAVELRNHDGDVLQPICVHFSVGDPAVLRAALEARDDVYTVEPGREWIWQRGDRDLGELSLGDTELTLEVDSRPRCDAACAWLEAIAGVVLEALEERDTDLSLLGVGDVDYRGEAGHDDRDGGHRMSRAERLARWGRGERQAGQE